MRHSISNFWENKPPKLYEAVELSSNNGKNTGNKPAPLYECGNERIGRISCKSLKFIFSGISDDKKDEYLELLCKECGQIHSFLISGKIEIKDFYWKSVDNSGLSFIGVVI